MIDREVRPGGILLQRVHTGFGFERFGKEMSGPEYAAVFEQKLEELGIKIYSSSMVTSITKEREVTYQNQNGFFTIKAGAIISPWAAASAAGEPLPYPVAALRSLHGGYRPKACKLRGLYPRQKGFVLGSGDIGLIMADRLERTGADVLAVCELMPYSNGTKKKYGRMPCRQQHSVAAFPHRHRNSRQKQGGGGHRRRG